jgi:hypothetical protein
MNKRLIDGVLIAGIIGLATCFASAFIIGMYPDEFTSSEKKLRNYVDNKLCLTFIYQCKDISRSDDNMNEEFWKLLEGKT